MSAILPRLYIFKAVAPRRVARPLLSATTRFAFSPLTRAPRRNARFFTRFSARLMADSGPKPKAEPHLSALPPGATMSQRLRHLIKAYGWYTLGVYQLISVLDFAVVFIGINLLGAEYVAEVAASVKGLFADFFYTRSAEPGDDAVDSEAQAGTGQDGFYATLMLAFAIHKMLMPIRVGLTAAFTPKIVGWLSARGWAGTAGPRRAAQEMRERIRERRHKKDTP
ncbi:hypothetical protein BJ912DRAFT_535735 [Pholiota molesta]|nr:hypothetical protein BJ912DRAFT_535735 [Pholiota molesta]